MTRQLNRRLFLRGLGGACVAAPFLGSLAGRQVKAQTAPSGRRLIAMFTYYGCVTTRWFPDKSHGALTAEDLESTTLAPLVPYVDRMLMPRGIRSMNEWTLDLSLGQGNDPYIAAPGSYFTCQPITPNSDNPTQPLDERLKQRPLGPSLDHVIAQQLSTAGVPLVMNVARTQNARYGISYSAAETEYRGIDNAVQIFNQFTDLFAGGTPLTPDSYQALRGKSVLDLVKGDLETLEGFDMSQADRDKLEAWKELLDGTSQVCSKDLATSLGSTDEVAQALQTGSGLGSDRVANQVEGSSLDGADLFSNFAVLSAACNLNPVTLLVYPVNHTYSGLGLSETTVGLASRVGFATFGGTCVPDVIDKLVTIDDFHARKFAYLVSKLAEVSDGDGSLLDGTAAVWFQEVSDGAARNLNNLPIVQVGSCGGYFKTGWAINVEDGSADLTKGNSEAVCGEGATEFAPNDATAKVTGTDRSIANAPINKYYCNLMNALSVKAGADGFPLLGGTEEVRCFGRYDKTEDFIGGEVNPPTIHDPGEFEALRASS